MGFAVANVKEFDLSFVSPAAPGTTVAPALTPAATLTGNGLLNAVLPNLTSFVTCLFDFTLTGATGGVTDVYVQSTLDGVKWYDVAHLPQVPAAQAATRYVLSITRGYRQAAVNPTVVNPVDGTPTLTANTVLPDMFGIGIRLVVVAGASTSAGATQNIRMIASQ